MVNEIHFALLKQGVDVWNKWRGENWSIRPDLSRADLRGSKPKGVDLSGADLTDANLAVADLPNAKLSFADLSGANLALIDLGGADLDCATFSKANLKGADLDEANLGEADLSGADLSQADLSEANLSVSNSTKASLFLEKLERADSFKIGPGPIEANLHGANLNKANLSEANLRDANLSKADLTDANLREADLRGAKLRRADLSQARIINVKLNGATLDGCRVFGTSAWGLMGLGEAEQSNLIITQKNEPEITVDNLEVAQFLYMLLHSEKVRDVINTIGQKGVLILGRFTERKHILEAIRKKLRDIGYVPFVFDFLRPTDRDFTETVKTLAGMSRFIIADITKPKSVPLELQAIIPDYKIPMVTIIERGEKPFSMFQDLWQEHKDSVLSPLTYDSIEQLQRVFQKAIVDPANRRLIILRKRKAEEMTVRDALDYE